MTARGTSFIPPWQDLATLSAHICTGESTIENWVKLGLFPAPRKIGGKRLWRLADVEKHLAGNSESTQSTSTNLLQRITDGTRAAAQR